MLNIGFYLRHLPASGTPIVGGTTAFVGGLADGRHEIGAAVGNLVARSGRASAETVR